MSNSKLAAIYNVWDGVELLEGSIRSIINDVDVIIIVYQKVSNFGEEYDPCPEIIHACSQFSRGNFHFEEYTPAIGNGFQNESKKRNIGLNLARELECTHFLHIDTDEYYKNFAEAKKLYIESGAEGSVCKLFTYFKLPTLRFETEDGYFVPFIHKLNFDTLAGTIDYPFYVDPTRRINCHNVVELPVHMHHFSWVRKDINRKARNSSAKNNIERGTMTQDYINPKVGPGFYVKDYDKKLIEVENYFNINL